MKKISSLLFALTLLLQWGYAQTYVESFDDCGFTSNQYNPFRDAVNPAGTPCVSEWEVYSGTPSILTSFTNGSGSTYVPYCGTAFGFISTCTASNNESLGLKYQFQPGVTYNVSVALLNAASSIPLNVTFSLLKDSLPRPTNPSMGCTPYPALPGNAQTVKTISGFTSNTWQTVSFSFTVPAGCSTTGFTRLWLNSTSTTFDGYLLFDNLVITSNGGGGGGSTYNNSCATPNFLPKIQNGTTQVCSQVYDNGTGVGINTTTPRTYNSSTTYATVIGTPTTGTVARLDVNGLLFSTSHVVSSDTRFKSNVKDIPDALAKVLRLKGVTYTWNKERYPNRGFDNLPQAGFLAQDVEKVYPEAIAIDNEGFYAMNYNAIIPLLSNAIKEQQATIEEVKKANEELKHALAEMCKKGCGGVDFTRIQNNTLFSGAYLLQNVPNPAAGQTKLGYFIPDNLGASSAKIIVTDLTGKTISTLEATPTGSGTVQFNTATLTAGIYSYSLIVDGNVADTKKMIVE
jgi:hypothetical protein